jgi:hypothetical protein
MPMSREVFADILGQAGCSNSFHSSAQGQGMPYHTTSGTACTPDSPLHPWQQGHPLAPRRPTRRPFALASSLWPPPGSSGSATVSLASSSPSSQLSPAADTPSPRRRLLLLLLQLLQLQPSTWQ